jgi:DNA-3-methyladenine glycosylase
MKFAPLPKRFYQPSASVVAPLLLGHYLIRRTSVGIVGGAIVETEAYLCENDAACHSAVGETPRNRVMWGDQGRGYIYYIYGNYHCFNAVCRPKGYAEAVLIRAVEANFGEPIMRELRKMDDTCNLTNGPGKLCMAMDIDRELDGVDLCDSESPLFIARNPTLELFRKERGPIITTTRVGITKAADLPLRFFLDGSPYVSKRLAARRLRAKSHSIPSDVEKRKR